MEDKLLPREVEPGEGDGAEGDEEEEPLEETLMLDEAGRFDNLTVWGHEVLPDAKDDPFSRGVAEWIKFAEAVG